MKSTTAIISTIIFSLVSVFQVNAQAAETIWIASNISEYKTGETITVNVNAISATPIQGFNFQIRYDPACLTPVNATSPITGMNGLFVPQNSGLVDASFASTTPLSANGLIAEVRFTTLGGCQTNLSLENASLAIRNEAGFAAQLPGVSLGTNSIQLNIDATQAGSQEPPSLSGTPLSLAPSTIAPQPSLPNGTIGIITALGVMLVIGIFILFRQLRGTPNNRK